MSTNPLLRLLKLGQSVWYDYIRRDLMTSGELDRLIREDGLRGMTSNPTIFEKAISQTSLYDGDIRRAAEQGLDSSKIFDALAVADVRRAADAFRPVFEETGGDDGFVSIEVAPQLARDTAGSIAEARRLWKEVARPNLMVKIPGTKEGVPAIRTCLAEGININITLLFSVGRYREVMEAFLSGLEERAARGEPVDKIRSVASFFVSRVDTKVDKALDGLAKAGGKDAERAKALRGKAAIGNARLAYLAFEEVFGGARFAALKARGVAVQRPLWASTSTKDPAYPELYYVEALVAPQSVDTMPPETFAAYREAGDPKDRIHEGLDSARSVWGELARLGIDERKVCEELEEEGVRKFTDSFDALMKAISEKEKATRVA
jgi:transaldolase